MSSASLNTEYPAHSPLLVTAQRHLQRAPIRYPQSHVSAAFLRLVSRNSRGPINALMYMGTEGFSRSGDPFPLFFLLAVCLSFRIRNCGAADNCLLILIFPILHYFSPLLTFSFPGWFGATCMMSRHCGVSPAGFGLTETLIRVFGFELPKEKARAFLPPGTTASIFPFGVRYSRPRSCEHGKDTDPN